MIHIPVLIKEVLSCLDPKPGENFIDGTIGEGGHAIEILKKNGLFGKLLGIDLDKDQIEKSRLNLSGFKERVILINDSYANVSEIVKKENFYLVNGILIDLGFSSRHIAESGKGFSFMKDEPLNMRYDVGNISRESGDRRLTAAEIINTYSKEDLERILKEYGEERFAINIAKNIILARKDKIILRTKELVQIVGDSVPSWYKRRKLHYATKTFQALRIEVNQELDNLKNFLPQALEILEKNGRLVMISFHSLEDRIVKNFFRDVSKNGGVEIVTKKPIVAGKKELLENPHSRSAKLRAVIKK